MNKGSIVFFLALLAVAGFGQSPQRKPVKRAPRPAAVAEKPVPTPTPADPAAEQAKFDEALAMTSAADRGAALKAFLHDFPKSEHAGKAAESFVTAQAIVGDERLQAGDTVGGIAAFKQAVEETPVPIPERLFTEIVSKFPANLFYRGQRAAAIEIALAIEKKSVGDPKQLLDLAGFYLGIESGSDAKRLAEAALAIDANSATAYQTLGLANRLDFDLEGSAKAYAKALELDPASVTAKRSLAEMKRALGKPDEAAALYRDIITANAADAAAQTGLALSLFDAGKRTEAEAEMAKALEQNPKNLSLLAGAAYWYAANDAGDKAVELAQKAVEAEPRYIWGHIALARGLMKQKRPVEAERVLVMARQYGNFPTLEYEIASARLMAGFYREAAEELQKSFSIKDGVARTRLGGRVYREEKNFADLVAYERRASTFEPAAADNPENAAKLMLLFELSDKLSAEHPDEADVAAATDEFVKGDDAMKLHRELYAASLLLQKNIALAKVLELVKAAVGNADAGLDVPAPAAAVMASELYESRSIAFARNEMIVVPDVPRPMLSAILRGRIEELAGWTLYQQHSYPEAIVRLRRGISVLPDKSAWWRSTMWRLGAALEADGKDKDALDSYIQSYKTDRPSALKYSIVEALYKKVYGNTDGFELKMGPSPSPVVASAGPQRPPETIAKPDETVPAAVTSGASVDRSTFIDTAAKPAESADPPKAVAQPPETTADVPQTPVKAVAADNANSAGPPKIENVKTETAEPAATTSETSIPKTENVPVPEKQAEVKSASLEPAVQETAPPKTETPTLVNSSATDATPQPVDDPAKPGSEKPKLDTITPTDAKADNTAMPVEIPVNTAEQPAAISREPKTEVVPDHTTTEPSAVKPDETIKVSPAAETEKKTTGSDPPASSVPQTPIENPASEKAVTPEPPDKKEPKPEPPTEKPADRPADTRTETKADQHPNKPVVIVEDLLAAKTKTEETKNKLFEPVIITVPNNSSAKPKKNETEKPAEPAADDAASTIPNPRTGKKGVDRSVETGALRARVVEGKEISSGMQCSFELSQQSVSLINDGGTLGILVTVTGEGDVNDIVASSSSPKDVTVAVEPEIAGLPGRRFYILKSVSKSVGVYQVTFESACGKQKIAVRVR